MMVNIASKIFFENTVLFFIFSVGLRVKHCAYSSINLEAVHQVSL